MQHHQHPCLPRDAGEEAAPVKQAAPQANGFLIHTLLTAKLLLANAELRLGASQAISSAR